MTSDLDPTLTVLLYSSLAAFAAALGAVPEAAGVKVPRAFLGWSNALAAGLMLGVAYALMAEGLGDAVWAVGGGAVLGLLFVRLAHMAAGTGDRRLVPEEGNPNYGYQVVLVTTLHGAYEGVAIGVAMLISLPFGISMALALAVHNIPEAVVLSSILSERGVRSHHAAALAVATNTNQVLVAVTVFTVMGALEALVPWALGFAVGALLYSLLSELLPESYEQVGHTSIALVTLSAMAIVVALVGRG